MVSHQNRNGAILSPRKEIGFLLTNIIFMMIMIISFLHSPRNTTQCSASRPCCAFLSCDRDVCRDTAVVIEGTETIGYNATNNNLPNRFGEGDTEANQTQVTAAPTKCAEIGGKVRIGFGTVDWFLWLKPYLSWQCYKESECCVGLRCHGFLHQCVT